MRISLDYDKTYTADPKTFDRIIELFELADHEVVIVTFRPPDCPIDHNPRGLEVYYTSATPKKRFMDDLGISIDIWIDDDPSIIVQESTWTVQERERWKADHGFSKSE